MQFLAAYIMKGRMQAVTVAATLAMLSLLFPPLSIVSSASVALVTLRLGGKEGLFVLLCACLVAMLLSMLLLGDYHYALISAVILWLPVWIMAIILRVGRNLAVTIEIAVLLGVVAVIGFYGYEAEPKLFWQSMLVMMIQPVLAVQPDVPVEVVKQFIETISHYVTGLLAAGSVFSLLFGLLLGRWWQDRLFNPGGFTNEYLSLKGHVQLAIVTLLLGVAAALSSGQLAEVCWNVLVVLLVFYCFVGTAVLHCVFSAMKGRRYLLPIFYVTLFAVPHLMVLIALCGISDAWLNLRNKLKPNGV